MNAATPAAFHAPAFIKGVTLGEVVLGAAGLAVLVVILRLTRAVGRLAHQLARKSAESAAAPAKSSGGGGGKRLLLLLGAVAGGWFLVTHMHTTPGGAVKAAPPPSPSPTPTVTKTVAPHVAVPHFSLPFHLSGTDVVWMCVIGAVVAIVLLGPLLRRSDS